MTLHTVISLPQFHGLLSAGSEALLAEQLDVLILHTRVLHLYVGTDLMIDISRDTRQATNKTNQNHNQNISQNRTEPKTN